MGKCCVLRAASQYIIEPCRAHVGLTRSDVPPMCWPACPAQMYHPYVGWDFVKIQEQLDNCFVVRVLSTGLEIKGQMVVAYHNKV